MAQHFLYFLVLDFEATCKEEGKQEHEIIEFPCLLVRSDTMEVVSVFHEYVRPVHNPILSKFCIQLTGITQDMVDDQPTFTEVLKNFESWYREHNLNPQIATFVTCGLWDLKTMLPQQCENSKVPIPYFLRVGPGGEFVNIKYTFATHTGTKPKGLQAMLNMLGLEFEGRPHSGIDDCRNITRILANFVKDGVVIENNGNNKPNTKKGKSSS